MPYAHNQGVRIHYQVQGEGSPLVLRLGDSVQTWYELGYVDALKPDHRLILVDARGYGTSDKPREAEPYRPERDPGDVVTVLSNLDVYRAHFFGYSMGGWIAFAIAQYAADRVHGLIIGGGSPNPMQMPDRILHALNQGVDAIPGAWACPYHHR